LRLFTRVSGYHLTERATAHRIKFIEISAEVEGNPHKAWVNTRLGSPARLLLVTLCLSLSGCHQGTNQDVEAKISFTQVPQWTRGDQNQQDVIEGTVSGARPGQRLVVYSKSGGLWWLQPLLASPFTAILPDQVWRNETHLGTEYAVLLVDSSFHPAAILSQLPKRGQGIAAVAATRGQEKSSSFFID
jgi:hypothetical protein